MDQHFWQRMQKIDPRVLYTLLLVSILIPLFINKFSLPIIPSQQSLAFYNTVQQLPTNKLVIVDGWWSPSTRGENAWQAQAILIHLMQRRLPFVILSFDPKNNQLTQNIVNSLAPKYHYVYGKDYVNWGYRPSSAYVQIVKGLGDSIPGTIQRDYKNKPITSFPVMQGIKTYANIGAIVEITASPTVDTWIGLAPVGSLSQGKVPILFAPTAVMAPTYYPYIDSGQIAGMLTGIKGAGDYEQLIGVHAFGTRATGALSLVYGLLILFVVLGNVGYHMGRAAERRLG
jgi:hypothetical protein